MNPFQKEQQTQEKDQTGPLGQDQREGEARAHALFTLEDEGFQGLKKETPAGPLGLTTQAQAEAFAHFQAELSRLPLFTTLGEEAPGLRELAQHLRTHFQDVIFLGTGGSSLGGQTLYALAKGAPRRPGHAGPTLHFMDNIDESTFEALFQKLTLEKTAVVVVSKSGNTLETLMQFQWCAKRFQGYPLADHFFAITEPGPGALREIATTHGLTTLDHATDIGGRFCVFTAVGALPALVAGLDLKALFYGAAQVVEAAKKASHPAHCQVFQQGLAAVWGAAQGMGQTVMMPYVDRLEPLGEWYCQLWAESVGKQGRGTTPVRALGTVDQHSQLQLYLEGPADKLFTLLCLEPSSQGASCDALLPDHPLLKLIHKKTLGDLLAAEQQATLDSLRHYGRPVRVFWLPTLEESVLGALMAHFMMEVIAAAALWQIDPFDQPAVEDGKRRTQEYLRL